MKLLTLTLSSLLYFFISGCTGEATVDLYEEVDSNYKSKKALPIIDPISEQSDVIAGSSIVSIDANVNGKDLSVDGKNIIYKCSYDSTVDGQVLAGSNCTNLSGLTFSTGKGLVNWITEASQSGVFEFKITALDGELKDEEIFTISFNRPPVLDPISDESVNSGQAIKRVDLNDLGDDFDVDGDLINYSCTYDLLIDGSVAGVTPCTSLIGLSFSPTTGVMDWTPNSFQYGTFEFEILGTDGFSTDSEIFGITVNGLPELAGIADQFVNENSAIATVDANDGGDDFDVDLDTLTYSCTYDEVIDGAVVAVTACSTLSGVSFIPTTGVMDWTPGDTQSGTYEFKIKGDDGASSDDEIFSITVVDPINVALNNPKHTTATPDSVDSISLFWMPGEDALSEYQISWALGSTPPATCLEGNVIDKTTITGESHQIIGLSNPNQEYAFRVCVVDGDGKFSSGSTIIQKTFPTCDDTVAVSEDFQAFQTRLDAATDLNIDGVVTICIDDDVSIYTNSLAEGNRIQINTSDVYIYANRSSTVLFENSRTLTANEVDNSIFYLGAADNFSVANIEMITAGEGGSCFNAWALTRTASGYKEISNIDCITTGDYANGFVTYTRVVDSIKDINVVTSGVGAKPFILNEEIKDLRKFTVSASSTCASCAGGINISNNLGGNNIYWGDINSPLALSVRLYASSLNNLQDISTNGEVFIGTNSFITNAKGLLIESNDDWDNPNINLSSTTSYITNLEDIVLIKNGKGNSALYIHDSAYIDLMKNVQIKRSSTAVSGTAQAIQIKDTGWVNSANVENIEVCSELGAIAFEDYTVAAEGLLDGTSSAPGIYQPYVPGIILGAQTFPFDILDGSGAQGGAVAAKNIILGGSCSIAR